MKNLISQIRVLGAGAATFILALTLVTLGALSWTNVHAEIENTPHNLAGLGAEPGPGPNTFSGTASICVFCHTPHGGSTSAAVPLWNRNLAAPTAYTTYATLQTSTLDGEEAPVGSVSIACLSCHDGTQAMDTVLNEPGSGVTNATFSAGTWTGNDRPQGIADITQDLTNDHPIGIQYGGGGITVGAPTGTLNDPDFNAPLNTDLNGTTVWWVDTETPTGNGCGQCYRT